MSEITLTARQNFVLERLQSRTPIKVIAQEAGVSETRINMHIRALKDIYNASTLAELIAKSLQQRRASNVIVPPANPAPGALGGRRTPRIFIGHGRSPLWRELKDFLQDRLGLSCSEFNSVSAAGVSIASRLEELLDSCDLAFLIMTAEDETLNGVKRARMNVIHEIGLFQGRLGFSRAIVLLEEGCEEFSNISGLGQIRFAPGNIEASFEQIRLVLEREGLIEIR